VTIGSATDGEKLSIDLGGADRTFSVTSSSTSGQDRGEGVTLAGVVSNGSITKTGSGWLRLNGAEANTITGLTVSAGVVSLGKTAGVDAVRGDILVNGGVLLLGADHQIPDTASITLESGGVYFAGTSSSFSSSGSNSPKSPAAETVYDLNIHGGTFNSGPITTGSSGGGAQGVAGTLRVSGGNVTIRNRNTFTAQAVEISGTDNTNSIALAVTSSSSTTTLIIGSGGLTITNPASGALKAIAVGALGALRLGGDVAFTGYAGNTNTTMIAATAAGRTLSLQGATRTFTVNDGDADVDLLIGATDAGDLTITDGTGTGGITKEGQGTLEIACAGTYTGATTVSAGRLLVNGTLASAAIVNGGTLGGKGTISGGLIVNAGTVSPGNSIDTFHVGDTAFGDNSNLQIELGTAGACDVLAVTGNLDLTSLTDTLTLVGTPDGGDYVIVTYTGTLSGQFDTVTGMDPSYHVDYGAGSDSRITLTTIPEPGSLALLALAAGLFLPLRRRIGRR